MINEDDEPSKPVFDARAVNLTKINRVVDCEIIIAECTFSIQSIDAQMASNYGDVLWREDAERARVQYEHKRSLAEMKRDALSHREMNPEEKFANRFVKAAQEILPPAAYDAVFDETCKRLAAITA